MDVFRSLNSTKGLKHFPLTPFERTALIKVEIHFCGPRNIFSILNRKVIGESEVCSLRLTKAKGSRQERHTFAYFRLKDKTRLKISKLYPPSSDQTRRNNSNEGKATLEKFGSSSQIFMPGPISKRKGFGGLEAVLQMILKYGYGFREQFSPIPNGYRIFRFPDLLWKPGLVDSDAIDGGGTAATASTIKNKKIWSKDKCTRMFLSEEMRKLKRKLYPKNNF
ncbi:Uncharacterized protein Adt_33445 [Abeliophyllum distichum]|uniref:Uncharacterized protein n=1 Tax=Abeliophyllum distichum TaxID=126358 RepID=A0ABD1QX77_9LAMI